MEPTRLGFLSIQNDSKASQMDLICSVRVDGAIMTVMIRLCSEGSDV